MDSAMFFNPEDAAKAIFMNSYLRGRQSKRQTGMGSKDFQNNKIRSCSYVQNKGKDIFKAVPFYDKRPSESGPSKSLFSKSWNSQTYANQSNLHAGMGAKKPLQPYNPQSTRNLMPISDFKSPYRNSSRIQIGQRQKRDTKHYISNYGNNHNAIKQMSSTTHPGIQAMWNKWIKSRNAL